TRKHSRCVSSASSGRGRPQWPPDEVADSALLARRLANLRRTIAEIQTNATTGPDVPGAAAVAPTRTGRERTAGLAARLAADLDGEVVRTDVGTVVRVESPARPIPIDREALARLPGQPPADVPLVCLDTETTGLGSAAGTVAFLVGLGWWEGQQF